MCLIIHSLPHNTVPEIKEDPWYGEAEVCPEYGETDASGFTCRSDCGNGVLSMAQLQGSVLLMYIYIFVKRLGYYSALN